MTEGTLRPNSSNSTLFHSFDIFSPESAAVVFDLRDSQNSIDTSTVNTIISRVTGSSSSSIDGFLGIDQDAGTPTPDLFLINPNGIDFGVNAFVSVPGSFVASTAESILFEEGVAFSALDASGAPPLLTVSAPIGLQMGANQVLALAIAVLSTPSAPIQQQP
ncbi:MAG: filamentous hemagglutinin N-terminal domain-containing protein [Phormidesmis sp. RL_2_1]|nr:filamentous hemagglutinin N-terminal domain-containing protein [Phormidesmis sp. RL_2_1]